MESGENPERARRRECTFQFLLHFLPQKSGHAIGFLSEKVKNITQVEILFKYCFSFTLREPKYELIK
jgi:hypothetical protein